MRAPAVLDGRMVDALFTGKSGLPPMDTVDIAQRLGAREADVAAALARYRDRMHARPAWLHAQEAALCRAWDGTRTIAVIADELGMPPRAVGAKAARLALPHLRDLRKREKLLRRPAAHPAIMAGPTSHQANVAFLSALAAESSLRGRP